MPKQLEEIKSFTPGIVSSPNTLDIPKEAATFSKNIDPNIEQGALRGINSDKVLTETGWRNKRYTSWKMNFNVSGSKTWAQFMGWLGGQDGYDADKPKWFIMHTYFGPVLLWFTAHIPTLGIPY